MGKDFESYFLDNFFIITFEEMPNENSNFMNQPPEKSMYRLLLAVVKMAEKAGNKKIKTFVENHLKETRHHQNILHKILEPRQIYPFKKN
ncbi:hypothetical protein [Aequorivita aurantiaca]|nr:hypothetical protein [Aequorivita aurantiaca]